MITEQYRRMSATASEALERACHDADCTYKLDVQEKPFEGRCIRTFWLQGTNSYNIGELYFQTEEIIHIDKARAFGKETSKTCLKKIIEKLIEIVNTHKQNGKTISISGLQHFSQYLVGGRKVSLPKAYHSDLSTRIEDVFEGF